MDGLDPNMLDIITDFLPFDDLGTFAAVSKSTKLAADKGYTRRPQPDAGDVDLCVKRLVDAGPAPGEREWFPNLTGDMDESDIDESDMESDPECGGTSRL